MPSETTQTAQHLKMNAWKMTFPFDAISGFFVARKKIRGSFMKGYFLCGLHQRGVGYPFETPMKIGDHLI